MKDAEEVGFGRGLIVRTDVPWEEGIGRRERRSRYAHIE